MVLFNGKEYCSFKEVAIMLNISVSCLRNYRQLYDSDEDVINACNIFNLNYTDKNGKFFNDARSLCNNYEISYSIFKSMYDKNKSIEDVLSYCIGIRDLFIYTECTTLTKVKIKFNLSDTQLIALKQTISDEKCFRPEMLEIVKCITSNKRISCKSITFDGKTYNSITDLCKAYNINYSTFYKRRKFGYSIKECLRQKRDVGTVVCNNVDYATIKSFSKAVGISESAVRKRLNQGYSPEDIMLAGKKPMSKKCRFVFRNKPYSSYKQLAKVYGIPYSTLRRRLQKGMSLEDAISKRNHKGTQNTFEYEGKSYYSYHEFCSINNLSYKRFMYLLRCGSTVEDAISHCRDKK